MSVSCKNLSLTVMLTFTRTLLPGPPAVRSLLEDDEDLPNQSLVFSSSSTGEQKDLPVRATPSSNELPSLPARGAPMSLSIRGIPGVTTGELHIFPPREVTDSPPTSQLPSHAPSADASFAMDEHTLFQFQHSASHDNNPS